METSEELEGKLQELLELTEEAKVNPQLNFQLITLIEDILSRLEPSHSP